MTVQVRIQHHPSRSEAVSRVLRGLEGLPHAVVSDPDPSGPAQPWRTYAACLAEPASPGVTHRLILQDDAVVHAELRAVVQCAVLEKGDGMVSLYTGNHPMGTAIRARQFLDASEGMPGWVLAEPHPSIFPTVALLWPVAMMQAALDWIAGVRWYAERMADDQVLARWAHTNHVALWHAVPNAVDHPDDVPSLIPGQQRKDYRCSAVPILEEGWVT